MKLRYGTYTHDLDEAGLSIAVRTVESPRRGRQSEIESWNIRGVLKGDSPADLNSRIVSLKSGYSANGQDATLLFPDGSETTHKLVSANAAGGVRIVGGVSFPEGEGVEFATERTYEIQLEAEFLNPSLSLLLFRETLTFTGDGGPAKVFLPTLTGPPVEQIGQQQTTYRASQAGSAVGMSSRPPAPPPLWPSALIRPDQRRSQTTPTLFDDGVESEFEITWDYQFESVTPLT